MFSRVNRFSADSTRYGPEKTLSRLLELGPNVYTHSAEPRGELLLLGRTKLWRKKEKK